MAESLLRSCWQVASAPPFLLLAFAAALSIAPLFAYIGSAPAIVLEHWHLKETQFYYVFIPVVAGFMTASVTGSRMAGRVRRPRQIALGLGLMSIATVAALVAYCLRGDVPILLTQLLLYCVALGVQLSNPMLSLEMLDMHPLARGSAASVQAFISLGIGGVMMGMIAPVLHGNLGLLALISLAAYLVAWLAWRGGVRLRK